MTLSSQRDRTDDLQGTDRSKTLGKRCGGDTRSGFKHLPTRLCRNPMWLLQRPIDGAALPTDPPSLPSTTNRSTSRASRSSRSMRGLPTMGRPSQKLGPGESRRMKGRFPTSADDTLSPQGPVRRLRHPRFHRVRTLPSRSRSMNRGCFHGARLHGPPWNRRIIRRRISARS
jgi:hypothetical protein